MNNENALSFVESSPLGPVPDLDADVLEASTGLDLDKLPTGIVAGNALVDLSAVPSDQVRASVSLSMLFASRVADAATREGDDEDDWLASYKTNLGKLGFSVTQSAPVISRFKKSGITVHKAIIPFLTMALGGAAIGPVIIAALQNLQTMDENEPWIKLFDQHSRRFRTREMHFAAVSSDTMQTSIRHVVARLDFVDSTTNVLFFKITNAKADFESATTTMSANNGLLSVVEPQLRKRLEGEISSFIAEARTTR